MDSQPSEIDVERVLATARLARLDLERGRARELAGQFARILEAFHELAELELGDVEPLASPVGLCDVARDDVPREGLERERLLASAPAREGDLWRVPRAVGRDT